MKKESKKFIVVFVKETNSYGIAFNNGDEWLAECLFVVDDPKKENCLISENILWRMNDMQEKGYEYIGNTRVNTDTDFWNINRTLA